MELTIGQQELLQEFVLAHTRIGYGLTEIAQQMTRANDIAERRINGEETNLGLVSEAVQGLSTAMETGMSNLTDVVTAYVGEIRIGLLDAMDNDYSGEVSEDEVVPDPADFLPDLPADFVVNLDPLPEGETI